VAEQNLRSAAAEYAAARRFETAAGFGGKIVKNQLFLPGIQLAELQEFLAANNEKAFRAKQISEWLYKKCQFDPAKMLNLPASLREKLQSFSGSPRSKVVESAPGSG
jgi:hypothetical protein